jgi:hypothetical protein
VVRFKAWPLLSWRKSSRYPWRLGRSYSQYGSTGEEACMWCVIEMADYAIYYGKYV